MESQNGDGAHPPFTLTEHAAQAIVERAIDPAWVARVLLSPGRTEPDRNDPTLRHALGRIAERDDRVLRVVYNHRRNPPRIVTVYFDRTQRRKL